MGAPFATLEFLYVGTADFERDLAYYRDVLKAELVWNKTGFGAHVAAFRVSEGPLLLLADHPPAPSLPMGTGTAPAQPWPKGSRSFPYRSPQNWSSRGIVGSAPAATACAQSLFTSFE